jgi:hypothetical protein
MEPTKPCPQAAFLAHNLQIWLLSAKKELLKTPEVSKEPSKREKPMKRVITMIFLNSNIQ